MHQRIPHKSQNDQMRSHTSDQSQKHQMRTRCPKLPNDSLIRLNQSLKPKNDIKRASNTTRSLQKKTATSKQITQKGTSKQTTKKGHIKANNKKGTSKQTTKNGHIKGNNKKRPHQSK